MAEKPIYADPVKAYIEHGERMYQAMCGQPLEALLAKPNYEPIEQSIAKLHDILDHHSMSLAGACMCRECDTIREVIELPRSMQ